MGSSARSHGTAIVLVLGLACARCGANDASTNAEDTAAQTDAPAETNAGDADAHPVDATEDAESTADVTDASDAPADTRSPIFSDDFESYPLALDWSEGSTHGPWLVRYAGFGIVGIDDDGSQVLSIAPKASTAPGETHAVLVTSVSSFADLDVTVRVRTVEQLRTPTPNTWEMGWLMWRFQDDTHAYYLVLKPNGWELGKLDPAYPGAQRFLATGSTTTYPPGAWSTMRVRHVGDTIEAFADGIALATFTDAERPYANGSIALYCEDALVHFDDVVVNAP